MMEQAAGIWSPDDPAQEALFMTNSRILQLETRLAQLESQIPNSKLMSQKFWRRAFAVFGHQFCAGLAVYGVLLAVVVVMGIIFGILGAFVNGSL